MNPLRASYQQFRGAGQSENLNFFCAKGGHSDFGYPNRKLRGGLNFRQLVGPLMDGPMIPVEWKSMDADGIHKKAVELLNQVSPARA